MTYSIWRTARKPKLVTDDSNLLFNELANMPEGIYTIEVYDEAQDSCDDMLMSRSDKILVGLCLLMSSLLIIGIIFNLLAIFGVGV